MDGPRNALDVVCPTCRANVGVPCWGYIEENGIGNVETFRDDRGNLTIHVRRAESFRRRAATVSAALLANEEDDLI